MDHQGSTSQENVDMPSFSNVTPVPATQSSRPSTFYQVDYQRSTKNEDVDMPPCSNVTPVPMTQTSHPSSSVADISSHVHHRYPTRYAIRQQQQEAHWRTWRQGKIVIKIPSNMDQSQ